jgi:hypothetical protein
VNTLLEGVGKLSFDSDLTLVRRILQLLEGSSFLLGFGVDPGVLAASFEGSL